MQNDESIPVGADAGAANSRPVAAESATGVDEPGPATMTIPTDAAPEQAALLAEGERLESEAGTENEMIDVHAPHGGLHTWKDFWIHLGTITLGLLIAIGLEQTVEYFHHLHQRRDLEASILAECKTNKDRAEADFSGYDDQMKWLLGLHRDIGKLLATGGEGGPSIPRTALSPAAARRGDHGWSSRVPCDLRVGHRQCRRSVGSFAGR